jgi:hypothetical protein
VLGPIADELVPFRPGFGIDLAGLVERVVVGVRFEEDVLVEAVETADGG